MKRLIILCLLLIVGVAVNVFTISNDNPADDLAGMLLFFPAMTLTKIDDVSLTRSRSELDLTEANVLISKGDLTGETEPADLTAYNTLMAKFENFGINAKDSPVWGDEDIVEEHDYESDSVGLKAAGSLTVKRLTKGFLAVLDGIRNERVVIAIEPKDKVGSTLFIDGVKLTRKVEGKANSESSSLVVVNYMQRCKNYSDVSKIWDIPTS